MGIGFCEFLVASCAPSPEPSRSKTSEITLGLDSLQGVYAPREKGTGLSAATAPKIPRDINGISRRTLLTKNCVLSVVLAGLESSPIYHCLSKLGQRILNYNHL
jgi:hypothetical protein